MSYTDTVTVQYSAGGAPAVTAAFSATGVGRVAYSGTIADTTVSAGQEVDMAFSHTEVVQVFLLSTQNMTINTNSDSAPTQAIDLVANVPVLQNPFSSDVTKLYLRNASGTTAATVNLIVLTSSSAS